MFKKTNKKGISVIVGYVLLIVIALSISLIVYLWLQKQLPGRNLECNDETSISIIDYDCSSNNKIILTLKNTGFFSIDGFIIKATNLEDVLPNRPLEEISCYSTTNLQEIRCSGALASGQHTFFIGSEQIIPQSLKPQAKVEGTFNYADRNWNGIAKIQLIPFRIINKETVFCNKAAVTQEVDCVHA